MRAQCKKCNREVSREYKENNPEKVAAYIEANRGRINERHRKYILENINRRLSRAISRYIHKHIGAEKDGRHWEGIVGFTTDQLKAHIEHLFLPGMSWDNYGKWHIDHKHPVSAFSFQSYEDEGFKQCWALDNLQPLWARDNIQKSNKIQQK